MYTLSWPCPGFKTDYIEMHLAAIYHAAATTITGWWFQPIWKIWVKWGSSSPIFGVKIPKMLELPPPRLSFKKTNNSTRKTFQKQCRFPPPQPNTWKLISPKETKASEKFPTFPSFWKIFPEKAPIVFLSREISHDFFAKKKNDKNSCGSFWYICRSSIYIGLEVSSSRNMQKKCRHTPPYQNKRTWSFCYNLWQKKIGVTLDGQEVESWSLVGKDKASRSDCRQKNDFGAGTAMLCNAIPMSLFSN